MQTDRRLLPIPAVRVRLNGEFNPLDEDLILPVSVGSSRKEYKESQEIMRQLIDLGFPVKSITDKLFYNNIHYPSQHERLVISVGNGGVTDLNFTGGAVYWELLFYDEQVSKEQAAHAISTILTVVNAVTGLKLFAYESGLAFFESILSKEDISSKLYFPTPEVDENEIFNDGENCL